MASMVELGPDKQLGGARYPGTKVLNSFHSIASLLTLKATRPGRAANAFPQGPTPRSASRSA